MRRDPCFPTLAVISLALVACGGTEALEPVDENASMLLAGYRAVAIGDSITFNASYPTPYIQRQFDAAGWAGVVEGRIGYRIDQLRPIIQWDAAGNPALQRMFIEGGYNDAGKYSSDASWELSWSVNELHAAVHDVIDRRPNACVFLVTLNDAKPYNAKYAYAISVLNQHMRQIAAAFPKVHLIDWRVLSAGHTDWFAADGIHLTAAGGEALANNYRWFGTADCK